MFLLNYAALNFVCFQEPFYEKLRSCGRDGLKDLNGLAVLESQLSLEFFTIP